MHSLNKFENSLNVSVLISTHVVICKLETRRHELHVRHVALRLNQTCCTRELIKVDRIQPQKRHDQSSAVVAHTSLQTVDDKTDFVQLPKRLEDKIHRQLIAKVLENREPFSLSLGPMFSTCNEQVNTWLRGFCSMPGCAVLDGACAERTYKWCSTTIARYIPNLFEKSRVYVPAFINDTVR